MCGGSYGGLKYVIHQGIGERSGLSGRKAELVTTDDNEASLQFLAQSGQVRFATIPIYAFDEVLSKLRVIASAAEGPDGWRKSLALPRR